MPSRLKYCVYVLLSMHDKNLYVGFTTDLKRRLTEHFHGWSKAAEAERLVALPLFPDLSIEEVHTICEEIGSFLQK